MPLELDTEVLGGKAHLQAPMSWGSSTTAQSWGSSTTAQSSTMATADKASAPKYAADMPLEEVLGGKAHLQAPMSWGSSTTAQSSAMATEDKGLQNGDDVLSPSSATIEDPAMSFMTPEQQSQFASMTPVEQKELFAQWQSQIHYQQMVAHYMMAGWQGAEPTWGWQDGCDHDDYYANQKWKREARRARYGGQGDGDMHDGETQEQRDACEALSDRIKAGQKDAVKEAMEWMTGKVFEFSRRRCACRMVQKVIAHASFAQQKEIAEGLQGKVLMAVNHIHANYVMQEFVLWCPPSISVFVAREMRGHAVQMACARSACRVILRLLDTIDNDKTYGQDTIALIDELLDSELGNHLMHEYAHHVIARVLEKGEARQKKLVLECFLHDLWAFAKHNRSCYVLELAVSKDLEFEEGADDDAARVRDDILRSLVDKSCTVPGKSSRPLLVSMALNQSGFNVVRAMIQRADDFGAEAAALLCENERGLQNGGRIGNRILKEMHSLGLRKGA